MKALKANGIVAFVNDQFMGPPLGVEVDFFGEKAGTAMGLALFAMKSKVPVIPFYTFRNANGVHVCRCGDEIPFDELENKDDTIKHMTQKYTKVIEDIVREHPENWMWVHRRWKKGKFNDSK